MTMKLLTTITSPYGRVARIALSELGLDDEYELMLVKTRTPQNETTRYNPTGKVPTLLTRDGAALSEARLICYYLQRLTSRTDFVSDAGDFDSHLLEGVVTGFIDGVSVWLREIKRPEDDRSEDILRQERERATRCVEWFNERASALPTRVDFCSTTLLVALENLNKIDSNRWQDEAPALDAWAQALSRKPSIAGTA